MTKLIPQIRDLEYPESLRILKLPSIAYLRSQGNMIAVYKPVCMIGTRPLANASCICQTITGALHNMYINEKLNIGKCYLKKMCF